MSNPKITKTDAEWRAQLDDETYRVARHKGTERAFSGAYWDTKTSGSYRCSSCGEPLFDSDQKFSSGCGWPSFTAPADTDAIATETDDSHGMSRTEVLCRRCDAHLGHVFPDGPTEAGGLRYCINSCSLSLEEREESTGNDGNEKS